MKVKLTIKSADGEQERVSFGCTAMKFDGGKRPSITFNSVEAEDAEVLKKMCFFQTDLFGDHFVIVMVKDISSMTVIN